MADLTIRRDRFTRFIVITDDLEVFGITRDSVLIVDPCSSPQAGDLICVEYRNLPLIGRILRSAVLLPERELQIEDCRLLGIVTVTPRSPE